MRENVLTDYKAAGPDKKYSKTLRQVKKYTGTVILWIIMLLLTVMVLYPLLFVFTTSFKTYGEFLANPFSISFAHPENYAQAWIDGHFSTYFFNSVLVTGLTVIAKVFMSGLVAYCIAVLKIKGWKIVTAIVMSTMFFTGEITGIPQFLLARELNLLDTIWALIVPGLLGPAGLGVLLGMGYAKKIPKELHEAALLDGAGIFAIFWRIDLVLMIPMLTFVAIQTFTATWSDFFWPLITITTNESAKTLPLGLINFQSQNNSNYGVLCAGLCIMTVPIILLYCFLSKYFIEGVAAGAVKG
ncbi:MAG TPA: carbohydrate ABC transporter permease [Candidatus Borkfalkia excrementigallinarum]|uniref:Carbohydrate ABC transporter permease n=1 Tax=Candidatus Borkfalkia excrementigallinarum TaxID=2838506 RepID=A0A9D1ZUL5_9FIRM|nr:carbohydrate ABC transporter permease [Candidatus Borkfalkia excrementigallinarum]